jgi:hypothetical protein
VPFDPESKGGSESSVKLAKADLVPTEYNLVEEYSSFSALEVACTELMAELNGRPHSVTHRAPSELLEVERTKLHPVPDLPYTVAFGESRSIGWSSVVSFRGARYSVPHTLAGGLAWVRAVAGEVVIVAGVGSTATEVARHDQVAAGQASIKDEHYPERSNHPLDRAPRPTKESEASFLALGEGATRYLVEAAAVGTRRLEKKMAEAVTLAALHGADVVDRALGIAAIAGRFAEGDLESIIVHASGETRGAAVPPAEHSLASGTAGWSGFGASEEVAS